MQFGHGNSLVFYRLVQRQETSCASGRYNIPRPQQMVTNIYVQRPLCIIMRPSSLGGGRILRRTLSVCLSVCPSAPLSLPSVTSFRQPLASRMYFSARTEGIGTFRHALRAAYRTPSRPHKFLLVLHRLQFLMLNFLRNSYGKSNNFAMNAIRRHLYVKYYKHKYQ